MQADNRRTSQLILGAIGIVYGDIGTSPLYAIKACFALHNMPVSALNILGIISLICWSLVIVVSIKYIHIILRADNHGEGGILALATLCLRLNNFSINKLVLILGILGTALFYGDGIITPAISVLSALEGLTVVSSVFGRYIPLIAVILLVLLFMAQKNGSSRIGWVFGPVMVVWFITIGSLGGAQIIQHPEILAALNPLYGFYFLIDHSYIGLLTFAGVVLVLTGAEALYADIGHFTKSSIRIAWFTLVFPALLLNYFGQGALLLHNPHAIENPFYLLAPEGGLYALIALSTLATIIASQAIISGVFSLSSQAIQLGYFPRMRVIHTSRHQAGQVYVPFINCLMLLFTVVAVLIFQNSHALASAYGITVTGIMFITTLLAAMYARYSWQWSRLRVLSIFSIFLTMDIVFVSTNLAKILDGGWFPVSIAAIVCLIITTWINGREALTQDEPPKKNLYHFIQKIISDSSIRIPGSAIFMCRNPNKIPTALTVHLQHNKFLHEKILFLSIVTTKTSKVAHSERLSIEIIEPNLIYQVVAYYGFTELPDLQHILDTINILGITMTDPEPSFFLSKKFPVGSSARYLNTWGEKLFIFLANNALNATDFFKIPHRNLVELRVRFKI